MFSNTLGKRNIEKDVERLLVETVAAPSLASIEFVHRLKAATAATDTTLVLNKSIPGPGADELYVVIDAFTVQAEVRRVTAITGTTYTVAALSFAHAAEDLVLWVTNPVFDVKWFGALGNGTTDDTAAIQACIDDMVDGQSIVFSAGDYKYTTTPEFLTLNNIRISGDGTLKPSACTGIRINDCEDVIVDGLRIEGVQTGNTKRGINVWPSIGNCRHVVIKNCHISGFLYGIAVGDTTYTGYNIRIHDNWIELFDPGLAGSAGIWLEEPDCKVYNNTIQRYVEGIAVDAGSQVITGNHIWAESSDATPVSCISIRRGFTSGIANGFVISDNYLDGDFSVAHLVINVQAAEYITVTGNHFRVVTTMDTCIEFENGDTTWAINSVTIVGNVVVNVSGSLVSFTQYSGVVTHSSESFHIHSNALRYLVTKSGTRDDIRQVGTYAATFTPNPMKGRTLEITLTGGITINAPSNTYMGGIGNRLTFIFIQDATGGRTVTWTSTYQRHWVDDGNLANTRSSITFEWDGTTWTQVGDQALYGHEWIDISATSTIVGWTSYTTKEIFYKQIGAMVWVRFRIEGTSDSVTTSFTVPTANGADIDMRDVYRGYDAGGAAAAWYMRLPVSSAVVTLYAGMSTTAWTASGTKGVAGGFFYEI